MNLKQDTLYIFTDGSCYPNPGPGGWGAVLIWNGTVKFLYGGSENETNNTMELCAILGSLKARTDRNVHTVLYSDSQYCVNIMTKWWKGWEAKGWVTGSGKPVKNQGYIKEILQYIDNVQFKWVKGHDGHPLNEAADILSRKGRAHYGGGGSEDPDPVLEATKNFTYPYVNKWGQWEGSALGEVPFRDGLEVEVIEVPTPKAPRGDGLRDTLAGLDYMRRSRTGTEADQDLALNNSYDAADSFLEAAKRNGKL